MDIKNERIIIVLVVIKNKHILEGSVWYLDRIGQNSCSAFGKTKLD